MNKLEVGQNRDQARADVNISPVTVRRKIKMKVQLNN